MVRYRIGDFFFFQAEDGIRDVAVTGVQTCALPISSGPNTSEPPLSGFAHFGLTPQIVELQNQSRLFDRRLVRHLFLHGYFRRVILPLTCGFCRGLKLISRGWCWRAA